MSIREKDKLDLELMSYTDIAYEIIKEDKKQYNTPNLFREVCNLLELSEAEFEAKTDKRFILMDSVNWDLKENHVVKVVVDDGEDDAVDVVDDEEESEDEEEETTDEDDAIEDDYTDESDDDYMEDDLEDLNIVDEDDIEE